MRTPYDGSTPMDRWGASVRFAGLNRVMSPVAASDHTVHLGPLTRTVADAALMLQVELVALEPAE